MSDSKKNNCEAAAKYASMQQLMKKELDGKDRKPIYPSTLIQSVFDAHTGASLDVILTQFNSIFVQYQGSPQDTRNIIPVEMRRDGLMITYTDMDGHNVTERAISAAQKYSDHWGLDVNWNRIDELSLRGDISVSSSGTWIINGEDTGIKAVGPKGDTGLTPWLKTIGNKLHFSYDNINWEPCSDHIAHYFRIEGNKLQISADKETWETISDYIAAYFRFQASQSDSQGTSVGKIQISRDGSTWTDLSPEFTNNLRISGYVATTGALPPGSPVGTIYGVGPTYATEDTAKTNPIYRLYVYNGTTWVDNGQFTSVSAGVVQETGTSETEVMSQKSVTEKLSELDSKISVLASWETDKQEGFVKTNNTNGTILVSVGDTPSFTESGSFFHVKVKVYGGETLYLPYISNTDYSIAYPVLIDINNKVIEVVNWARKEDAIYIDNKYYKHTVSADGYLIVSWNQQFNIITEKPSIREKEPNRLEWVEFVKSNFKKITAYNVTSSNSEYMPIYEGKILQIPNQSMLLDDGTLAIVELQATSMDDISTDVALFVIVFDRESNKLAVKPFTDLRQINPNYYIFGTIYTKNSSCVFNSKYWKVNNNVYSNEFNLNKFDVVEKSVLGVQVVRYKYIDTSSNKPVIKDTSVSDYSITPYLEIGKLERGEIICKPKGSSPFPFAGIYDSNMQPLGCLFAETKNDTKYDISALKGDIEELGLTDSAYYIIFAISYSSTDNGIVLVPKNATKDQSSWWRNEDIYNYNKVLSMPKDVVKSMVETASCGRCTALYDDDGYPSLMCRIPIVSIGALASELGDFDTPHPAFIVNGEQKTEILMSVFQTCEYEGHLVSWFGLTCVSGIKINDLKQRISEKGSGWHLETIYERSLLSLLAMKNNSPTLRGNTQWGRSWESGYEHECVKMSNGKLPGKNNQSNGAKWINGTQPSAWSHNKEMWGIQDVIGGYHEICDLVKKVDGFIYIASDNNYNATNDDLINTGAAIDVIDGKNVFSNSVTGSVSGVYIDTKFRSVKCTEGYDTIAEDIRKKLCLLLIAPRMSSTDTQSMFDFDGDVKSNPSGISHFVCGGAEEYNDSGLGYYVAAYDLETVNAHNNMGSRLCYIE